MAKKTYNTIEDFLNDASFKNWATNGQLSDVSFWDFWLKNNPAKKQLAYEARDIVLGIGFKKTPVSEKKISMEWNKLESKLKAIQSLEEEQKHNEVSFFKKAHIKFAIAASILLAISFSVYTYLVPSLITHKTGYGEVLELKLKDGTSVTLNANSKISYYKNEVRKVWLEGEAYFKVHKKRSTNAKFWVNTNDLVVEVYGTEFNVNTSPLKTNVYLEEGDIWLNLNNGTSKKMTPGNYIEYSSKKNKIIVEKTIVSKEDKTSWKSGKLIFKNNTLEEVLNKITKTYGVKFTYNSEDAKEIVITGTVPTSNLNICLNAVKKSANITIKKENAKLVVYKND